MFDPKSNLAEQLAYALKHHQKHQQDLQSKQEEIERLRQALAHFKQNPDEAEAEEA